MFIRIPLRGFKKVSRERLNEKKVLACLSADSQIIFADKGTINFCHYIRSEKSFYFCSANQYKHKMDDGPARLSLLTRI